MPTATPHTTHKAAPRSRAASKTGPDVTKLLMQDHKEVKALFKEYDKLVKAEADDEEKLDIAEQICSMLTLHATLEEEIFYPAARDALSDENLIDEASVEHATARDLIAQIEGMKPTDALYDAKLKVLGEYIDHHVQEEETEIFPKLRKTALDLGELGLELQARKEQLTD